MLSVNYHELAGLNLVPRPWLFFEELAILVYGRQAHFLTHFLVTNLDKLCLKAFDDLCLQLLDDVLIPGQDTLCNVNFEGLLTKEIAPLAFLPEVILALVNFSKSGIGSSFLPSQQSIGSEQSQSSRLPQLPSCAFG